MISGFFDAAMSSGSRSDEETYDKACTKHDATFVRSVFSSNQSQRTTDNVNAWEKCLLERQGLFGAMTASKDSRKFIINVHYLKSEVSPPKLELKAVDKALGFNYTVDNVDISGFVPEDHNILSRFGIARTRAADKADDILVINTNVGELGPFDVPSKAFQELEASFQEL